MLKWAVNQPRNSYLAKGSETGSLDPKAEVVGTSYSEFHALRGKLRMRRSMGLAQGKENQLTSTPLPAACTRTPLLKDLSNILATPPSGEAATGVPKAACQAPKFACTLPTFEAEYSPNAAVIPGSLIALRGVGIPDSYFEKPRYLEQKPLPHPAHPAPPATACQQTTLSSSQMGDVTLERMIDAILESNRKVPHLRQPRQHLRQRHRQQVLRNSHAQVQTHSPTYRPAFDPASDLCEYWKSPSRRDSLPADGFEEREVRSPLPLPQPLPTNANANAIQSQGKRHSLQLRRQRVVRRKRKITTKISSSVRQSAQKLLAAARSGSGVPGHRSAAQKRRHISPDSGHNSTSDFEEELVARGSCAALAEAVTKRRLSFSFAEDLFVEK
ncbi:uncharacterized protein LOC128265835 [Drosophila gunungcola]|nr:uncharacterized protein LOC128265835 [Drosophila gunungcola]